jgi:hypothetical protein
MSEVVQADCYGDLIGDDFLNVSRADAVAHALASDWDLVAYAPSWLVGEKAFPTTGVDGEVVAGDITAETEKAYLLARAGVEAWFPKSAIRVYEAPPDADLHAPNAADGDGGAA